MKSSTRRIALSALMTIALAACGANSGRLEEGQVQLTITTVPSDVQCIRLTASNGSSVAVREFDVIPHQSASVNVNGLPTGTVTLTEAAYDSACELVAAETPPSWISRAPVVVQLQPGQVMAVNIELVRPGSVSVTNSFTDNTSADGGADASGSSRDGGVDLSALVLDASNADRAPDLRPDLASSPDLSPDRAPDLSPDVARTPDLSPDRSPDLSPDRAPDLSPDVARSPDLSPDRSPDLAAPGAVYRINGGATSAASPFAADQYYSGGTGRTTTNSITISGITNPAPAAVYQSERYGAATYTFPGLSVGRNYTVRLHFAELYWTATGMRIFNVAINGATVLSNFDIYAAAGNAGNKAVLREFTTAPNASGQIVVAFTNVTDNASIEGIEITY